MYGLHLFFVVLIFLLLINLLKGERPRRTFTLLAYVLGLSFTNHLQTVLFFPTLLLLFLSCRKTWDLNRRTFGWAGFLFLLGLSPYLYLTIRSATGPLADWGATADWGNFIRHVSGWQYRIYMFAIPFEQALKNGQAALQTVAFQLNWPFYLSFFGLFFFHRPGGKMLTAFGLYPIITLIYNAGYDIPDIEPYYLPVVLFYFYLVGAGALGWLWAAGNLKRMRSPAQAGILLLLLLLTIYAPLSHWGRSDRSKYRFPQEALENIYQSAPNGGLVFTVVWDHYAPWLYHHFVLGKRPDLLMLDVNLTNRSWYLDFLKRTQPETLLGLEGRLDSLREMIRNFERGLPFDTARIEADYRSMLAALIRKNFSTRPLYFDVATESYAAAGWTLVPEGVLFRAYEKPGYYAYNIPSLGFSQTDNPAFLEDKLARREVESSTWMLALRKNYERRYAPKADGAGIAVPP